MISRLRGLLWLVLLTSCVVGVPALVMRSGVIQMDGPWPDVGEMVDAVRQGRVSDDAALTALAILLGVLWLRFVVSVLIATLWTLRGLHVPHIPGLGRSTQRWATSMVAGVALLVGQHAGAASPSPVRAAGVVWETGDVQGPPSPTTTVAPAARAPDAASCAPLADSPTSSSRRVLGAGVLLAGGVLAAVQWRRRGALRASVPGESAVAPLDSSARLESQLRALSPVDRLVRLDTCVRALAARLIDADADPSTQLLTAVVHDDGRVDITLSAPAMLEAPFESLSPDWWRLPAAVGLRDLAPLSSRAGLASPCLAHLGRAEGGELFVDLEALGLLSIDASPDAAEPVVRSLVSSLCASPFSGSARIIATGVDPGDIVERSTADAVDSVDAALDLAAISLGSTTGFTSGGTSTFRLRSQGPSEGWDPALVLIGCDTVLTDRDAHDLVELTSTPGRGLAVLVGCGVDGARWRLHESAGMWTLQPIGMVVEPARVDADEIEAMRRLLTEAGRPAVASGPDPLAVRRLVATRPVETAPPYQDPAWSLMVRVLGPVGVDSPTGTTVVFDKARSLELVTWLAMHRERPSRSGARTALWETDVRDATFANVVSEARRALSATVPPPRDGEWLARSLGDNLPLHTLVVTDADLLERRLDHARRQSPDDAIGTIREGLAWVRGLPFSDSGYLWPDGDGITSHLVLLVTTAATEMATWCLAAGDIEGVFWATGRGLTVLPGHEELVGLRMRAHADRGDLSAVRLEWDSYLRALQGDMWGDAEPAPKLVALRHELLPARTR